MTEAKIWALSDFHLPSTTGKTMDKFGPIWNNHGEQILKNVSDVVKEDDILLVPGDISWAKNIAEIAPDFELISKLPCQVVMSEGNHDPWASKYNAVVEALPKNATWAVRGCYRRGNIAIVSTRLWNFEGIYPWPGHIACDCSNQEKMERREFMRLETALKQLPQDEGIIRIVMVHFPPLAFDASPGKLTELIDKFNVDFCIYGHIHGQTERVPAVDAVVGKTRYILASSDWLEMKPMEICTYKL